MGEEEHGTLSSYDELLTRNALLQEQLRTGDITGEVLQNQQIMLQMIQSQLTAFLLTTRPWAQGLFYVAFYLLGVVSVVVFGFFR